MTPWLLLAVPLLGASPPLMRPPFSANEDGGPDDDRTEPACRHRHFPWHRNEATAAHVVVVPAPGNGVLTLLGQPLHRDNSSSLGDDSDPARCGHYIHESRAHPRALAHPASVSSAACCIVINRAPAPAAWRGCPSFGLGILTVLLALALPAPAATIALLDHLRHAAAPAALHSGFVAALQRTAGQSSRVVGFLFCRPLIPQPVPVAAVTLRDSTPDGGSPGVGRRRVWLLRALIQSHPCRDWDMPSSAFFCMLWWYVAGYGNRRSRPWSI